MVLKREKCPKDKKDMPPRRKNPLPGKDLKIIYFYIPTDRSKAKATDHSQILRKPGRGSAYEGFENGKKHV